MAAVAFCPSLPCLAPVAQGLAPVSSAPNPLRGQQAASESPEHGSANLVRAGVGVVALVAASRAAEGLTGARRGRQSQCSKWRLRKRFATKSGTALAARSDAEIPECAGQVGDAGRRGTLAAAAAAAAGIALDPVPALAASGEPPTVFGSPAEGVYTFDQAYGIPGLGVGANIPIRCTVLALDGGGYLVYNPCQPTEECMKMLADAGLTDIRYIVLGTIAIEHKYYGPAWSKRFPDAEVWISPRTFSWPINFGAYLPVVGFPPGKQVNPIPKDPTAAPWSSKGLEHLQLTVDYAPRTVFEETVMYHKPSGTFVCTDMLIGLSDDPPEILKKSPYREGLVYFSRNNALEKVEVESSTTLRDGYQKSILLLNNINPRSLLSVAAGDLTTTDQLGLAFQAPQPEIGYKGWYPCNWQETDSKCAKLSERLTATSGSKTYDCRPGWRGEWARLAAGVEDTGFQVPSFVAELQISRDPEAVRSFASEIARRWPDLKRVVSSHFSSPLPATADKVQRAIARAAGGAAPPIPDARIADLSAILNFRDFLEANDLIYKPESGRGQWKWTAA